MSATSKLPLLIFVSILMQVTACRKDKKVIPPPPKTTEDYILEMVGTYKMVGYFSIKDPRIDSSANVSEEWTVEYLGNKRILAGNSIRGKSAYTFIFEDTAYSQLVFGRDTSSLNIDVISYFYDGDSIKYEGWYNSSFRTQSEYLHSVK
jgi:hypothetical protein